MFVVSFLGQQMVFVWQWDFGESQTTWRERQRDKVNVSQVGIKSQVDPRFKTAESQSKQHVCSFESHASHNLLYTKFDAREIICMNALSF